MDSLEGMDWIDGMGGKSADVGAVQIGSLGELLLRKVLRFTAGADVVPEFS